MHRRFWRAVVGILLLAGLVGGYRFWVASAQRIDYRIFDSHKTVSWTLRPEGIFRVDARGHLDNILLSRESWDHFDLTFDLGFPRDCGVIFSYQDERHFSFFNFSRTAGRVVGGRNRAGAVELVQSVPWSAAAQQSVRLTVEHDAAVLAVNGGEVLRLPVDQPGRFGLLLNDAEVPKTYFRHLVLKGRRARGGEMEARFPPEQGLQAAVRLKGLLPFYLMLLASAVWGAVILRRLRPSGYAPGRHVLAVSPWGAAGVHLLLAVLVFWPFISRGDILVSSYDNFGEIYPLFFLSKHNFQQILSGQSLCLWNPFTHNGVPFYSNHWNMIYYPFNWPVFLLPDRLVLKGLTLKCFLEVFLTGVLAFGFFRRLLNSRGWALLSSITYQLCSLLIFTSTVFPASALYFSQTLYLYLLWSMPRRRARTNFLLLTLAGALILTAANVAFTFYAVLGLAVITLYRLFTLGREGRGAAGVVALSVLTSGLIGAVRLIPCLLGIADSNRLVETYFTLHDRLPMIIRLFLPEIAGRFGTDAFPVLTSDNLRLIFQQANLPSNAQNTFFVYFGIIPAVLLTASWFLRARGALRFWRVYAWCAVAVALLFQPVWGVLCVLFFPMNHFSYHTLILPAGAGAVVGLAGQQIFSRRGVGMRGFLRRIIPLLILAEMYILVFETYLFPALTPWTRGILLVLLGGWGLYGGLRCYAPSGVKPFAALAVTVLQAVGGILFLLAGTLVLARPLLHHEGLAAAVTLPCMTVFAVVLGALSLSVRRGVSWRLAGAGAVVVFGVTGLILNSGLFAQMRLLDSPHHVYLVDMLLGQVKFLLIAQIAVLGLILVRTRTVSRRVMLGIFLLITAADLTAFNYRFENITAPFFYNHAFYPGSFQYPDLDPSVRGQLDLVNYRASALDKAGINANKHLVHDIPTYTGTIGYMPRRFSNLIETFGYPAGTILIYPEDSSNDERFLDLSAVRYVFTGDRQVRERPTALARMQFFYQAEVIPDETQALARLKDPSFDVRRAVVIPRPLEGFEGAPRTSHPLRITFSGRDEAQADMKADAAGVVLFNESFDPGWKARVDGREVPVMPADYNFMAVSVPAGEHHIAFVYQPGIYFLLRKVSGAALAVWGIVLLSLPLGWFRQMRRKEEA